MCSQGSEGPFGEPPGPGQRESEVAEWAESPFLRGASPAPRAPLLCPICYFIHYQR